MGEPLTEADRTPHAPSISGSVPKRRLRPAWAGALGGLIGGVVAGALGGALAAALADLGVLDVGHLLREAALGAAVLAVAAPGPGALAGVVAARRGGRAPFSWPLVAVFWAGLVATVEAAQGDWLSAARTFLVGTALLVGLIALVSRLRPVLWKLRWVLLGWVVLCLVGEAYHWLRPKSFAPLAPPTDEAVVQLGSAPLSGPLGYIARHHFFLSFDPAEGRWHRWDLWQLADAGGPNGTSWGHVHRDLLLPTSGVGGDPPRVEREWHGDPARALLAALARSADYPHRGRYVAMPGPNCNAYVAWVLRESGVPCDLDPRAVGKDYLGPVGVGTTTTGTGVQAESSLLGVKGGLTDGAELHFLTFTFGIDTWPPAIKTPLGRVGFDE